jgi:hypothetical protein
MESGYFGHPPAGFFFANDFFTASSQLPSILYRSGLGPGFGLFLEVFGGFFAMRTILPESTTGGV